MIFLKNISSYLQWEINIFSPRRCFGIWSRICLDDLKWPWLRLQMFVLSANELIVRRSSKACATSFKIHQWHIVKSFRWLGSPCSADWFVIDVLHKSHCSFVSVHQGQGILLRENCQQLDKRENGVALKDETKRCCYTLNKWIVFRALWLALKLGISTGLQNTMDARASNHLSSRVLTKWNSLSGGPRSCKHWR